MSDSRQRRSIRQKTTSKASLFLMEMMIGIVFFAIAATGCVQVFARAHLLSQEAEDLQMAQSLAAEAVEELRADTELWKELVKQEGNNISVTAGTRTMAQQTDTSDDTSDGIRSDTSGAWTVLTYDYDENWELCEEASEAEYHLTAIINAEQTPAEQMVTEEASEEEAAVIEETAEEEMTAEQTATEETAEEEAAAEQTVTEGAAKEETPAEQTVTDDDADKDMNRPNVRLGHIQVLVTGQDGEELYMLETDQTIPYTLADAGAES